MATSNPLAELTLDTPEASRQVYVIGGIEVDVYGKAELHPNVRNVACLWLLNPRLGSRQDMKPIADAVVAHWKEQNNSNIGIIVAAFDQRNHGSRLINSLANQSWRDGNPRHAQDMFSTYRAFLINSQPAPTDIGIEGTATDTSQLITYLPGYVFPKAEHKIVDHMVLGISLGGHSVWHLLLHEPRITTGIVIIGCPDYVSLMTDRARLSKLATWTQSSPPGSSFLGSESFPYALVQAVGRYDPTGYLFGAGKQASDSPKVAGHKEQLIALLDKTLRDKRILNLAGGSDKLVPYAKAEPFMKWLKEAISPNGWYRNGGIVAKDVVYKGVGHEMTSEMLQESLSFLAMALNEPPKSLSAKI